MGPMGNDPRSRTGSGVNRRVFLGRAAAGAAGFTALGAALAACGDGDDATTSTAAGGDAAPNAGGRSATANMGIQLGKQSAGSTLNFQVEAGLQADVWKTVAVPMWEKLTGTTVNIVEVEFTQQFQKLVVATQAAGTIDCAYCALSWLPDLSAGEAIVPIGDMVDQYLDTDELQQEFDDLVPTGLTAVSEWNDQLWGFPLDGPGLVLYYRTDIFSDPDLQSKFSDQAGYELAPPETYPQYGEIAQFLTDELAPDVYGALHPAGGGQAYFWWFQLYNSGEFGDARYFDGDMRAMVNSPEGVAALDALKGYLDAGPPGANTLDPGRPFTDFIGGKLAMMINFTPFARWASVPPKERLEFVPKSEIRGKFALAVPPGGSTDVASGYTTVITSGSEQQELAFAFLAWATSPDVYTEIVNYGASLCKPTRTSMFAAAQEDPQWPGQGEQYSAFESTMTQLRMEPKWLSAAEYNTAIDEACTAAYTGTATQAALDKAAEEWNTITDRVGADAQADAYAQYESQTQALRAE